MTHEPPKRSSTQATFRLRCFERVDTGHDRNWPVQLVVFDFDETLTLVTYLVSENDPPEVQSLLTMVNFESPWVEGSRIAKLRSMLARLAVGKRGEQRALAILTRNSSNISVVLRLLVLAGLAEFFCAIWMTPWRSKGHNGAYQHNGQWRFFDPPLHAVPDHKADLLLHVASHPAAWIPQLHSDRKLKGLLGLRPEGVVLVDDQRANFQSGTGAQLLRCCKVARYDTEYRDLGFLKNMGGIGAHSDADYESLIRFIDDPSMCRETLEVHCFEREFSGNSEKIPVRLVVFDFDETITLATFMPSDSLFMQNVGSSSERDDWSEDDLRLYNFQSPYVEGDRIAKLHRLFQGLATGQDGLQRTLAILTANQDGTVAVLNLLMLAGLAEHFSAIWTVPQGKKKPTAAYQQEGVWTLFDPPLQQPQDHKADILTDIARRPRAWFPQLSGGPGEDSDGLLGLKPASIVLIDDERANFRSDSTTEAAVLRCCKVPRYDDAFRDCGPLNQLGGVGAHSDADYESIIAFVERPWNYRFRPKGEGVSQDTVKVLKTCSEHSEVRRSFTSDELTKADRRRSKQSGVASASSVALCVSGSPGEPAPCPGNGPAAGQPQGQREPFRPGRLCLFCVFLLGLGLCAAGWALALTSLASKD